MNDLWRQFEQLVLGQPVGGEPGGLETSLQPTWDVPPWLVLCVLLASSAILIAVYLRESPSAARPWKILLSALRLGLVAIVLIMLYGWTVQRHRTDRPDVVVLLDDSASMALADPYDDKRLAAEIDRRLAAAKLAEKTRINLAKSLLLERDGQLLASLAQRYNLKFFLAAATARSLASEPQSLASAVKGLSADGSASRLGDCVREVLEAQRGRPTAAIIVLTDGITTEGRPLSEAAQYARRKSVPLFLVGLGSDQPVRDQRVADLLADEVVFVGDLVTFDFKLSAEGYTGKATVRLTLVRSASEAESRASEGQTPPPAALQQVAQQEVDLNAQGGTQSVRLTHRPDKQGAYEYTVEVVPREGEANIENNRLVRKVIVREEVIRVLLVQAYPSYEFRMLKHMLQRELNRDQPAEGKTRGFRTVLQEADLEYVDTDKTAERLFPVSRDELFTYDVLIFGDVNPALLSPSIMQNVYEFVTVRGGGIVFIAGPRYTPLAFRDTPLAPLFPLDLDTVRLPDRDAVLTETFRPRLTPLGQSSPMMQLADSPAANDKLWREGLPPLLWYATVPDLRPGVRVLAEHPSAVGDGGRPLPIICLQFIGAGKVLFHATDETHRWRLRVGDLYFARYWIQTIRYLCRAKLLTSGRTAEVQTDREEYRRGDTVSLRVRFLDDRLAPQADDGVTIVVEREGGQRRSVTLRRQAADRGVFAGTAGALPDGQFRAWIAAPTLAGQPPATRFQIVAPPGELARTRRDTAELTQAAKVSLGKFYRFQEADRLLDDLPHGRQVRIESLPPQPIWNAPLLAALFVLLIGSEWLLRKRVGLL